MRVYGKRKVTLSPAESEEVERYMEIYKRNGFEEHYEVNRYITETHSWDEYPNIRSLNDHGEHMGIPGILPRFYAIICEELEIAGAGGVPLDKATHY